METLLRTNILPYRNWDTNTVTGIAEYSVFTILAVENELFSRSPYASSASSIWNVRGGAVTFLFEGIEISQAVRWGTDADVAKEVAGAGGAFAGGWAGAAGGASIALLAGTVFEVAPGVGTILHGTLVVAGTVGGAAFGETAIESWIGSMTDRLGRSYEPNQTAIATSDAYSNSYSTYWGGTVPNNNSQINQLLNPSGDGPVSKASLAQRTGLAVQEVGEEYRSIVAVGFDQGLSRSEAVVAQKRAFRNEINPQTGGVYLNRFWRVEMHHTTKMDELIAPTPVHLDYVYDVCGFLPHQTRACLL